MATSPTTRPQRAKQGKHASSKLPSKTGKQVAAAGSAALDIAGGPKPLRSEKEIRLAEGVNWPVVGWLVLLHAGALAAPFTFTWQALVLVVFLHWLAGGVGVCLGYHRLLTHASFETYKPFRWLLAMIGGLSGEGSPIDWVANHRKHHAHSDQEGDPHTPHDGKWWSHVFWMAFLMHGRDYDAHVQRWAPDLAKDRSMQFLTYAFLPIQFLVAAVLTGLGYWMGGWQMAVSFLVWGVFLRLVLVMHSTWFVNSASHIWGYRNYTTTDDSRNNWWVAAITYGEGWHNNHHAYPRMANHGHRWWEIDLTFRTIRLLQRLGLAWNVVDYKRKGQA
jgi:fatty-acid desaturase